jgi:predicted ferric reductase
MSTRSLLSSITDRQRSDQSSAVADRAATSIISSGSPSADTARSVRSFVLGSRRDWHIRRPTTPRFRLGWHLLGPLAVIVSCLVSWPAFAGAQGEDGNVAFGLWIGAVSILTMSWSFILAIRPRILEPLFGGLDSMYRVHRWAGALSILFMFLHTSVEPEIEGGILGASRSVADSAEDLAGVGEVMLYVLIALSVVRLFPYRWWRLTHKLLGIPFAFACWHFFTAEKTYANGSPWGWWFGFWMVAGLAAFVHRVIGRDMLVRGRRYRVVEADHQGSTTRLELEPVGKPIGQALGQFAFLKLQVPGMSEPHPFTIASAPEQRNLEFYIRHLGDWSQRLPEYDLVGQEALVEGPYGEFAPFAHGAAGERSADAGHRSTEGGGAVLWVAGGVGITPFLAALDQPAQPGRPTPTLLYAVRDVDDNPIVDRLREAEREGRVNLHLFTSATGRLTPAALDRIFPEGLNGAHVALCGPAGLVATMADAASARGSNHPETEDFDMRQGFGPERSSQWRQLAGRFRSVTPAAT